MNDFTSRTGFSEYIGVHDRDYSAKSGKLAFEISEKVPILQKKYISGGRIAAELDVVVNRMKVGAAHFSQTVAGLNILNLLYIDIPCRGNGIASKVLRSLTDADILFAARPSPFTVINNASFDGRWLEISSSECLDKDFCLLKESNDQKEIEKLRNWYINLGFKRAEVVGSDKYWVCNFKNSIIGTIHLLQ